MGVLDRRAPRAFLQAAFEPDDAVAVFLKSYATGATAQRVVALRQATSERFLAWLRARNAERSNIYVGVNAVDGRRRSRSRARCHRRRSARVRRDRLRRRQVPSWPRSPGAWSSRNPRSRFERRRVGLTRAVASSWHRAPIGPKPLQKALLARELGGDTAATSCAQTTRIPGFFNHKRSEPHPVTLLVGGLGAAYGPSDFPAATVLPWPRKPLRASLTAARDRCERARAYLDAVPPAVSGAHGDQHTFRVCCRVVRGFDLDDESAVATLSAWNARCVPPWSQAELQAKVQGARAYGREPFGGFLRVWRSNSCVSLHIQVRSSEPI